MNQRVNKWKISTRKVMDAPRDAVIFVLRRLVPFGVRFKDMEAYRICTWHYGKLPRTPIIEVFPGIEKVDVTLHRAFDRTIGTSVDTHEIFQICAIEKYIKARKILEIGTFDGNTAMNLAVNTTGRVTTVDLPPDWDGVFRYGVPGAYDNTTNLRHVGIQYKKSKYVSRIRQVLGDSANLDWSKLGGPFDLIFIDGCHYYDYVKRDTENSLKWLKRGGILMWHDYGMIKDVSRVVDDISQKIPVYSLRGTRIAVAVVK